MLDVAYTILWVSLSVYALFHLLLHKREPYSTLTWLLFVLLIPIIGPLSYLFFGPERIQRKARRRKAEISLLHTQVPPENYEEIKGLEDGLPQEAIPILKLGRQVSDYPFTDGNDIHFLPSADSALEAMKKAIREARLFIHMQYYIISSDEVTEQLFGELEKACERGVEVRILYDSLGSLFLKKRHFSKLLRKGALVEGFLPFSFAPQRFFHFHFRNHRKILVIDGVRAFTGGTNIGKEYLGAFYAKQWKDYTFEIKGPVCEQLSDVFAKDWYFTNGEELSHAKYFQKCEKAGTDLIQVLESGPDSKFYALHQALFMLINSAQDEILLTTAYFVPDSPMLSALISAALRGVRVRLLLPSKSDAPFVQAASRSFYEELLRVGVEIYEYQPRILHAKLLIIDNRWTVIGSANMDTRSFKINFELNLLIYGKSIAQRTQDLLALELKDSVQIHLDSHLKRPLAKKLIENLFRLFSPIL